MFVLMWLSAIASSPGGMSAFAHDIIAVEQELLPAPPDKPATSEGSPHAPDIDAYFGGVVCMETAHGNGGPEVYCHVPAVMLPY
jgi:hypothetical protein